MSAIVLATFMTRKSERDDKRKRETACSKRFTASASVPQYFLTSCELILELNRVPEPENLSRCIIRAFSTLLLIDAESSHRFLFTSFSYGILGTYTSRSILSMTGPDSILRYLVISPGEHLQRISLSKK